eukprot:scaffold10483_cov112-Isochrysis_galbana.AAC.1
MRAHAYSSVVGGLSRGALWRVLGGVDVFVEAVLAVDAVALEGRVGLEFAFDHADAALVDSCQYGTAIGLSEPFG